MLCDALTMAHTIRPERYTILGDNGISEDAAYGSALKTGSHEMITLIGKDLAKKGNEFIFYGSVDECESL